MLSFVPSIVVLGLAAIVALKLALGRPPAASRAKECVAASRMLAITTVIQCGHFIEEWVTGFHVRFPALFGLEPMQLSFFVAFNLTWIVFWVISIPYLQSARTPAFFAAWFLAIAGMLNGIAHPLMAVASGGYFPGLISSPFIGLASVYLWRRLYRATSRRKSSGELSVTDRNEIVQ